MHTTQLLVLLGGAKLGVELVSWESGVIQDGFSKELYFGHAKKDRDRLESDRTIRIRSTPAF